MQALLLKGIACASVMFITLLGGIRTATAQVNSSIFGPNVWIIDPTMPIAAVNTKLNTTAISGTSEFGTARSAVFFMPGTYDITAKIGFSEAVYGLGANPRDVVINGYITPNYSGRVSTSMTTVFWRSMANLTFNPGYNASQNNSPNTLQWGVSQGTSLRRVQINGNLQMDGSALLPAGTICGWASGGFVADIVVTGYMDPCAQQQWYTRNSELGSWNDVLNVWNQGHIDNMVFSGVVGAPPQTFALADPRTVPDNTVLDTTPRSREMPFIYVDSSQNFNVFVPGLRTNSWGTTWSGGGLGYGNSLPISTFFIATPASTLAQINTALASGQNLILTPGIYTYSGSINVTNPNAVILGIGYADLVSQAGTPVITIADVDGVHVAGLLIDATTANAAVLLQVGTPGAPRVSHTANPTTLSDIFVRVGGYVRGTATTSLQVDSDDVILDNMWLWRADHGTGAGWTSNLAAHGLVVNGDNVLATGLAVEHYQQNQVVWNGNGGETIFFQDEPPYDVPSQAAWMNGIARGFSPYSVSPGVTTHKAYGLGAYSNFTSAPVILDSAFTVPVAPGVTVTDALTYNLSSLANSGIAHVVDDQGASVGPGGNNTAYLAFYGVTPLTVTANNATMAVGAAIPPPFSVSYSGFVNADTAAVLGGSSILSTTATSSSPAGLYPITVAQGTLLAANNFPYTFNFVAGTLSVIAAPTIILNTSATLTGSASTGYTVTVTVANTGTGPASNVVLTTATLGTATGSALPQSLGSIAAGGHVTKAITFPGTAGADGAGVVEKYTGTYTGGTFMGSIRAVLP